MRNRANASDVIHVDRGNQAMNWSFQLYSARDFQPWDGILRMLSRLGYGQVEGFGGVYDDPPRFRALMDENGLSMPTAHFGLAMLEDDFAAATRIAETLGVKTIVAPYLVAEERPGDAAGWQGLAARLARVCERCRDAGYGFAWHNHDFEFAPLKDGTIPMATMLDGAPEIGWEIDVAWVVRGGADPLAWIDEYGPRIGIVHLKDIAPAGEARDEDGWADVGHGTVPWPAIMRALGEKTRAEIFVMEHDRPNDIERFARRSLEAARKFEEIFA
jgi:sugar phosphate isomerase/epimerase